MSFLIDTCCISELVRKKPDHNVLNWFANIDEVDLFISVITIGELTKGVEKLPQSKKKLDLQMWIQQDLKHRFANRILDLSSSELDEWGILLAKAEKRGQIIPAIDGLLAATAKVHELSIVTRNVKDFLGTEVDIINPWEG